MSGAASTARTRAAAPKLRSGRTKFPATLKQRRAAAVDRGRKESPLAPGDFAMNVRDCMSHDVHLTSPDETMQAAARMMKEADTGALPVGENDRLVGMVTDRDIAVRGVGEGRSFETPVREVMTTKIEYVFEDDDLGDVSAKMGELKVRRLPVLNREKRLVGIVSLGDIAKADSASYGAKALSGVSEPGGPHTHA
jgi:CBS domain-containing protein